MIPQSVAIPYCRLAVVLFFGLFILTVVVQKKFQDAEALSHIPTPMVSNSDKPSNSLEDSSTSSSDSSHHDPILANLKYLSLMRNDHRVNCRAVAENNQSAMDAAIRVVADDFQMDNKSGFVDFSAYFLRLAQSCSKLIYEYGFITDILSKEEREFPVAFSIVSYKDIEMLIKLLRSIYRPQNYYCIHLDASSTKKNMFEAVSAVARCLPNVYMASKRLKVQWATISSLEADIVCMGDMWKYKKWKYYINLTGQEFPLKTNYEMVKILKTYNGANDVPGTTTYVKQGRIKNRAFPFGMRPIKGPVHVTLSRPFVDFILHDNRTKVLLKFLDGPEGDKMFGPDEFFFSVLNHNPSLKIPGSFTGDLTAIEPPFVNNQEYEFIGNSSFNRYKQWVYEKASRCAKNQNRGVCILTTGDLPRLSSSPYLIANKFYLIEDRVVIGCLEEMLMNRTLDYYLGKRTFDTTVYENAPFVKNSLA